MKCCQTHPAPTQVTHREIPNHPPIHPLTYHGPPATMDARVHCKVHRTRGARGYIRVLDVFCQELHVRVCWCRWGRHNLLAGVRVDTLQPTHMETRGVTLASCPDVHISPVRTVAPVDNSGRGEQPFDQIRPGTQVPCSSQTLKSIVGGYSGSTEYSRGWPGKSLDRHHIPSQSSN